MGQSQCGKFKKNAQNKSKVTQVGTIQETLRAGRRATQPDQQPLADLSHKQIKPTRRDDVIRPAKSKTTNVIAVPAVQCQSDSMSRELQNLMMQADNSMQQLLNSSINQFTRYLEDRDNIYEQHHQLVEQNTHLKASLDQLKHILKSKLDSAIKKQKEELAVIMQDYFKLITKLLADKEQLTVNLENLQAELIEKNKKIEQINGQLQQNECKIDGLNREKNQQIINLKGKVDEFERMVQEFTSQAEQEARQKEEMAQRIEQLESQLQKNQEVQGGNHNSLTQKVQAQNNKIQTLLELLEQSQQQNRDLRQTLHKLSQSDNLLSQLQHEYSQRLEQLERDHQEQFSQYQRAVQQHMAQKDQYIERLNNMIKGYKRQNLQNTLDKTEKQ